ncbi:hypothetical protein CYMTET_12035 [Cymbomonas tetramitiformis]|uniref:EF-hand domain-containing protein n=1 Tax=Cymbomonas tetramitiformis TaxID=36881 RepID=A0AAE0LCG7_9CHLO|nr:hypothetical protein CYMTET_12035 [Cymbomonas tetramitiformis]|eukprot:gene11080-13097_t
MRDIDGEHIHELEVQPGVPHDVFFLLHKYMKDHATRSLEIFRQFDRNRSGALDIHELSLLVQYMIPGTTTVDVDYFIAMLDVDRGGTISYKELKKATDQCYRHSVAVRNEEPTARKAIGKLKDRLKRHNFDAIRAFKKYDTGNSGYLTYADIIKMLRTLLPNLTLSETRYIMANLKLLDLNCEGRLTFDELQRALEPEWLTLQKAEFADAERRMNEDARLKEREHLLAERELERRSLQRRAMAEDERREREEHRRMLIAQNARIRKMESGSRKGNAERIRREAEAIAVSVKREKGIQELNRSEALLKAQRKSEEEAWFEERRLQHLAQLQLSADSKRMAHDNVDDELDLRRAEREYSNRYRYREPRGLQYLNLSEFATDKDVYEHSRYDGDIKYNHNGAPDVREDLWTDVKVVDHEELPISSFSRLQPTKRYNYYKYYGFAGKGAKSSWAHNPAKAPYQYSNVYESYPSEAWR